MTRFNDKTARATSHETQEAEDRRNKFRRRVLKGAYIEFAGSHGSVPCAVRDISDTGARIKLGKEHIVPERFSLIIELDGLLVECRSVWRSAAEAGLEFIKAPRKIKPLRMQVISPT